jgi:hypothetical protein
MDVHSYQNISQLKKVRGKIPFFVLLLIAFLFLTTNSQAQMQGLMNRVAGAAKSGGGGGRSSGGGSDSLQFEKRKFSDDSVNVRFRYLDTARFSGFDSTIDDYFLRVPLKADVIYLGNNGTATRPILFSPLRGPGWDAGFHGLDIYSFNIAETKFMNTTKPYTQLGFLVGSKAEQNLDVIHTQNATPDLNFVIHYRLINAPGAFNSQNTNHNNIRFNSDFSSKSKRYHAFFILMSNALQSSENGGITDEKYLVNPNGAYNDRFNIPTNLASALYTTRNFFNVKLYTGNRYTDKQILFRQQYDFGKKDSIVTDSTVVKFFLPRIRFEHTIHQLTYNYKYVDIQAADATNFYKTNYGLNVVPNEISYSQQWKLLKNDFSIVQFPDAKNPLQFFKAGLTYINLSSDTGSLSNSFVNIVAHGEYRNRTKNKKWDMLLFGELYAAGRDAGNYLAQAKLQTYLGKKVGMFEIGFKNINRSPSYLYTYNNIFPLVKKTDFNDENVTSVDALLYFQPLKATFTFNYFLINNYTYFTDYNKIAQSASLFNFFRVGIEKDFNISKHWKWRLDAYLQSVAGNAPIHVPFLYTRNRIAYEANPFRNLFIATGMEFRYYSDYYADGYSPVLGQFFYQSKSKLSILPEVTAYMNFRIRSFTSFIRLENLNTATSKYGFGFKNSNLSAPLYPMPGMVFRLGIFWNFVN